MEKQSNWRDNLKPDSILDERAASNYLLVSTATLRRLVKGGELASTVSDSEASMLGSKRYYRVRDLLRYLQAQPSLGLGDEPDQPYMTEPPTGTEN